MQNGIRLKMLVVALGLAACAAASAAPATTAVIERATVLEQGDLVAGPLALSQSVDITVTLKLRNKQELDAKIFERGFRPMSGTQFAARYSPTTAQAKAVADFLTQAGFTNVKIAPNRLLVSGTAPAANVQRAFNTSLVSVTTHEGRMAYANSSEAKIPASLQSVVRSIFGLETVHLLHTYNVAAPKMVLSTTRSATNDAGTETGHNPVDFPTIYGVGNSATGSTISAGVIVSGDMSTVQSDFAQFLSQNHLPNIPLHVVGTGSGHSGDAEWDMDTQSIVGMSGGVKDIYLYQMGPGLSFSKEFIAAANQAVADNVAKVINASLGTCENSYEDNGSAKGDDVFEQAVAQGQTFTISTGDSGGSSCRNNAASWPADSQYVLAVSGTGLYTTGSNNTTWANETVWNQLATGHGATGGSPSIFEPQPSWQHGVGQNAGSQFRGLGDVALDGDPESGELVIVDGGPQQWGGTSLSSPLTAGLWARALATNPSLGFAAPHIYADATSNYASDFNDVTEGDNNGYSAFPGWDYPSGFGSPKVAAFVSHIAGGGSGGNEPPVASFSVKLKGLFAQFTDTSTDPDGTIASRSWDFGDGSSSTTSPQLHHYAAPGTYTVTLTVTDNGGATDSTSQPVTLKRRQ